MRRQEKKGKLRAGKLEEIRGGIFDCSKMLAGVNSVSLPGTERTREERLSFIVRQHIYYKGKLVNTYV